MDNNDINLTYDEILYYLDFIKEQKENYLNAISVLKELEYKTLKLLVKETEKFDKKECIKAREKKIKEDIKNFTIEKNTEDNKIKFVERYSKILNFELEKRKRNETIDNDSFISKDNAKQYHINELKEIVELVSHTYPSSIHELAKEEYLNQNNMQLKRTKSF